MDIHQLTFSPTGGTCRVSESICKAFDVENLYYRTLYKAGEFEISKHQC